MTSQLRAGLKDEPDILFWRVEEGFTLHDSWREFVLEVFEGVRRVRATRAIERQCSALGISEARFLDHSATHHRVRIKVSRMESEIGNSIITIRGLVIPVDWDDRGNVTATAISTHFEEDYLVDQNAWGEELIAFLRQKVRVSGSVIQNKNGKKFITVKKYEVLEE